MSTVTMETEGKGIETALGRLGVNTKLTNTILTPQEYCFNYSGGWYTKAAVKRAMDFLNCRYGYNYELNTNGGFTVKRTRENRQYITFGDTINGIQEAVKNDTNGNQKVYLSFGQGENGYVVTNMQECAHILIAGTTGSGKSCLMNSLIMQILCFSKANLLLIDPKNGAEFGLYEQDVHNRIARIAKTTAEAIQALSFAVDEMERRYSEMSSKGLKHYDKERLIIVIDELADLMMASKSEVEDYIIRIAQKGRAAGVQLIVATQDPRASVVTGLIKYNLPTKICLKTANARHSMNVIDCGKGAELLDKGDGLVKLPSSPYLQRVQCPYITDAEIIKFITTRTE